MINGLEKEINRIAAFLDSVDVDNSGIMRVEKANYPKGGAIHIQSKRFKEIFDGDLLHEVHNEEYFQISAMVGDTKVFALERRDTLSVGEMAVYIKKYATSLQSVSFSKMDFVCWMGVNNRTLSTDEIVLLNKIDDADIKKIAKKALGL